MTGPTHPRGVRSFVLRAGRMTDGQQRALERLWPQFGLEYTAAACDLALLFGRVAPRVVEIGFGNGANLIHMASAHPHMDFLGIEVHRPGVGRVLLDIERLGLRNVRVSNHDAVEVLGQQLPEASLDEVLVLFPDPWHKKRHHKRRLLNAPFVALLASRLKPAGLLRAATDWEPYACAMLEVLGGCALLENSASDGGYVPRPESRQPTRFERRGERLGHGVWDLAFRRRAEDSPQ
ncbi:MAG TPA: tRNA (guanosine(46)-N7)-methyltransferase TrmB [Steroidobacteraceae bacterium]|jgi:tRNA (guanine-N7-)-methyltransferase|nr:tRNA (guanosine(46)-N7)-methyltransferase TrmB [Steroidobacteraceae bacterium]